MARKAGLPWDAAFLVTLGAVIAGVGIALGVAGGGTPFGGGGGVGACDMFAESRQVLLALGCFDGTRHLKPR